MALHTYLGHRWFESGDLAAWSEIAAQKKQTGQRSDYGHGQPKSPAVRRPEATPSIIVLIVDDQLQSGSKARLSGPSPGPREASLRAAKSHW